MRKYNAENERLKRRYVNYLREAKGQDEKSLDKVRAALAFMGLKALDRGDAMMTAEAALCAGAGQPHAPLFGFMDQAAFWADMVDPEELEAYCLASFNAMPRGRQAAFLDHVQGRQAA